MGYSLAEKGPDFGPLFPKNGNLISEKSLYNLEYLGPIRLKIGSNDLPWSLKNFTREILISHFFAILWGKNRAIWAKIAEIRGFGRRKIAKN